MNKDNNNSSKAKKNFLKELCQILIKSDIPYLPTIGKFIQLFGKYAITFLLGLFVLWAVALRYPLPGYNMFNKNVIESKEILLQGNVKIKKEEGSLEPYKNEFQVGVLSGRRHGPFNDTVEADGSFSVKVPYSLKYNIVVWDEKFTNFRYFGDKDIEQFDGKYRFKYNLVIFD